MRSFAFLPEIKLTDEQVEALMRQAVEAVSTECDPRNCEMHYAIVVQLIETGGGNDNQA